MNNTIKGRGILYSFDWKLVLCYLLLLFIGWINIYASIHSSDPTGILDFSSRSGKQLIWIGASIFLAILILFILPTRLWENTSLIIYGIVIIALITVIFFGVEVKGSKSWFQLGQIKIQPAEISKISTSLLLAFIMSRDGYKISKIKDFIITALCILIPMGIIIAEKETGSALVYTGFIFMLYREGLSGWFIVAIGTAIILFILTLTVSSYISLLVLISFICLFNYLNSNKLWKNLIISSLYIIILILIPIIRDKIKPDSFGSFLLYIKPTYILVISALATIPYFLFRAYRTGHNYLYISIIGFIVGMALIFSTEFIFNSVLKEHQRKRIEILLGMKQDPSGVGYNVHQSMIAIGSGGLTGKGFLNGTQTTYGFVPEQSTDFIFCTIGEEWGFLGCAFTIILYVFIMIRILYDAEKSREKFTRIYGYCTVCCIFMHLFINIGMTIGLMPVIGIPLPLVSYGGSSLFTFTALIFIFIALDHQEKKYF